MLACECQVQGATGVVEFGSKADLSDDFTLWLRGLIIVGSCLGDRYKTGALGSILVYSRILPATIHLQANYSQGQVRCVDLKEHALLPVSRVSSALGRPTCLSRTLKDQGPR